MREHDVGPTIKLSLPVAKQCGPPAGILYPCLQAKRVEQQGYRDEYNVRRGLRWIPSLPYEEILRDLDCFDSSTTIKSPAKELEEAGLIKTESTGRFLEPDHVTERKRDIATWWHVLSTEQTPTLPLSLKEISEHGIPCAVILAHWRSLPEEEPGFRRLSAAAMAKVLPMDERTVRRHLKNLITAGVLRVHPTKPKLYRM